MDHHLLQPTSTAIYTEGPSIIKGVNLIINGFMGRFLSNYQAYLFKKNLNIFNMELLNIHNLMPHMDFDGHVAR